MDALATTAGAADAASLLALLEEPDQALAAEALRALDAIVPQAWPEISEALPRLEALSEDDSFAAAQLASLVVSKVYFHLGRQTEALSFALVAGDYFDPIDRKPGTDVAYADSMLRNCVNQYVKARVEAAEAQSRAAAAASSSSSSAASSEAAPAAAAAGSADTGASVMMLAGMAPATATVEKLNPRLVAIVERLISDSVAAKDFSLALGLAVDSRRFDIVERIVMDELPHSDVALECCRHLALDEVARDALLPRSAKMELVRILVRAYQRQHEATRSHRAPEQAEAAAAATEEEEVNPKYLLPLVECHTLLGDTAAVAAILRGLTASKRTTNVLVAYQIAFDLCASAQQKFLNGLLAHLGGSEAKADEDAVAKNLRAILNGELMTTKDRDFLFHHNHTDVYLLNTIKSTIEEKNSITHAATLYANALMHAGTAVDTFVRQNLDWFGRASHWAKFAATAGFGVIHKGSHQQSRQILSRYLPPMDSDRGTGRARIRSGQQSVYNEGGALYALGLIHANHGSDIVPYLLEAVSAVDSDEVILHGACLGLGIAAMGTDNNEYYEQLKTLMYAQQNGTVAGEAAGLAMGLVHMGSMTPHIAEMLAYAHQTTHERVCRGLVLGIAVAVLGRQEEADVVIEQLVGDKDPVVRYGGAFAVALAYCGTGSTQATRQLLRMAVSDVSDDVRRAALTGLGFVLFTQPHHCPPLVQLLMDSYNPHVRYGATMALGIACAGTALPSAIDLLEPMTRDSVDFVRQGAMVALGLVLVEATAAEEPRLDAFNKQSLERIDNVYESVLCKIGAILAQGLVNAGGRNVTISCATLNGDTDMRAVVGLAVFCQYWFWQPYILFASLAMKPTAVLALDENLRQVPLRFKSNVAPSMFAYPPGMKPPEKTSAARGPTAVLSYGHGKPLHKPKQAAAAAATAAAAAESSKEEDKAKEEKKEEKKKPKEPAYEVLTAPCRVTMRQRKYLSFGVDERYVPVKTGIIHGITLVRDTQAPATAQAAAPAASPAEQATTPAGAATTEAPASKQEQQQQTPADDCPPPPAPFELPL